MNPFLLLKPEYLFDPTPGEAFSLGWPLLVLFLAIFAGSLKVSEWVSSRPNARLSRKFLGGIPARMREFAVAGIILSFFRAQNIPYLGMRFWTILLVLLAIAYGVWVWKNYQKNFRKELRSHKQREIVDHYKPQAKKKKRKRK
jgi:protein-S-isoprenylcysteine O-methyltransferase Ste14